MPHLLSPRTTSGKSRRLSYFFAFVYCKNVKIWYHTPKRRTLLDGGGSRR